MRLFTTFNNIQTLAIEHIPQLMVLSFETSARNWKASDFEYFLNSKDGYSIGYFDKENILGYLIVLKVQDEADIINLVVHSDYRKRGIATQLLDKMLKSLEINKIFLEVDTENKAAIELYKKFNFSTLGVRKKYYEGKRDAFQMVFDFKLNSRAYSLKTAFSSI